MLEKTLVFIFNKMTELKDLLSKKFRVNSEEESTRLQEFLFTFGIKWYDPRVAEVRSTREPYIMVHKYDATGVIVFETNETAFRRHSFEELSINDVLIKLDELIIEDNLIVIRCNDTLTISKDEIIIDISIENFILAVKNKWKSFREGKDEVTLTMTEINKIRKKLK